MKVDSHNIEFGYELLSAIPYAYELHLKGELTETVSGTGSEPLYYFSPKHTINKETRSWFNTSTARKNGIPWLNIHQPEQPDKNFPDYKTHYKNDEFKFKKPTLCICNRYNREWSVRPINYLDTEILDWMFSNLKSKYHIIYFPVAIPESIQDNEKPKKLDDLSVAYRHEITVFTDLLEGRSWNEVLLKVFANCEHYITMNGGYSILASYFSGTNIVYSKPGEPEAKEIKIKSFWRWYPNINNVRTIYVPDYDDLKIMIRDVYIDKKPCVNILIRTFRPNYLRNCMKSIKSQSYKNINVVFICDSETGVLGTREHDGRMIRVDKPTFKPTRPQRFEYGVYFPYNSYMDYAQRLVNGYIMCLDDDDKFVDDQAIEKIMSVSNENKLMIWKVDFNDMGIKPSHSFGKSIELFDIGGIGFMYHSNHVNYTDWTPWKIADFRTARKLSEKLKIEWIDEILTGLQDQLGAGVKQDLKISDNRYKMTFEDGSEKIQCFTEQEIKIYEDSYKRQGICIELVK